MNIVMAFDDGFLLPSLVAIFSLFENNDNVNLNILYVELSAKSMAVLRKLERVGKNNHIYFLYVEERNISKIKISTGRWRPESFFRYFSVDLLDGIDRVLWLDSDILVRDSLSELYNTNLDGYSFCAVCDDSSNPEERLGITDYVNSGVLLMNLDRLRLTNGMEGFWKLIENDEYNGELPDQDALNIVFRDEIRIASSIWNNTPIFESESYDYYINNTRIVHYSSSHKPWKVEDAEYYLGLYDQYPSVSVFVPEYWDTMERAIESVSRE